MVKYYFFKTVRIDGYMKLRLLPGQTTYLDCRHQDEPAETGWNVQTSSESRHVQCVFAPGTIFAARLTGNRPIDVRLLRHSRGGTDFYRLEGSETYPIASASGRDITYSTMPATQDMRDAYQAYRARMEQPQQTAEPAPREGSVAIGDEQFRRLASLGEQRITDMSAYVNPASPLGDTLLKLSRLRDIMTVGVARFTYVKQNGDRRTAYGTLCEDHMDSALTGDRQSRQDDGAHFAYYDIQRCGWRCFCVHDFVDLDEAFIATDPEQISGIRTTGVS